MEEKHYFPKEKTRSVISLETGKAINVVFVILLVSLVSLTDCVHGSSAQVINSALLTKHIATNRTIKVDMEGNGDYKSVQAAIDAVPAGNSEWIIIHVRKGVYREKVTIPKEKPFIFLRGNGRGRSIVLWSESSTDNIQSAVFKVEANNVIVFGMSFKNDAPTGVAYTSQNQSVAAFVGADKVAFYSCSFYSTHNTLFDYKGRHYYGNCYIQGSVDFIFGRSRSIFHNCEIFVIDDKRLPVPGSITAQNRESANEKSGYVFLKGRVYGVGDNVHLGRAKGAFSRVIFAQTYLSRAITPEAWSNWSYQGSTENLFHAEYQTHGPGANATGRAPWAKQLSEKEAEPFISIDFIDGKEWLPAWL